MAELVVRECPQHHFDDIGERLDSLPDLAARWSQLVVRVQEGRGV